MAFGQPEKSKEIDILFHQSIPMRDGITLSGTIVKPKNSSEKFQSKVGRDILFIERNL